MRLAVIPARGGSKRIPRKNVKAFHGKPMIAWTIEAAAGSGCFDKISVSTDDEEIAALALRFGAEVPFRRPAELSDDYATTSEVMQHAVSWYETTEGPVSEACCLYATAPFLSPEIVRQGLRKLQASDANYAVTVTSFSYPVQRACKIENGKLVFLWPANASTRSQDLEESFHDAGQLYWGRTTAWIEKAPIFDGNAIPLLLPRGHVQDIDTLEDWRVAESLFATWRASLSIPSSSG